MAPSHCLNWYLLIINEVLWRVRLSLIGSQCVECVLYASSGLSVLNVWYMQKYLPIDQISTIDLIIFKKSFPPPLWLQISARYVPLYCGFNFNTQVHVHMFMINCMIHISVTVDIKSWLEKKVHDFFVINELRNTYHSTQLRTCWKGSPNHFQQYHSLWIATSLGIEWRYNRSCMII